MINSGIGISQLACCRDERLLVSSFYEAQQCLDDLVKTLTSH